jgi:hypothetical protein
MNARFVRRVSISFWETSARIAVAALFPTNQTVEELERRQFPWQGTGEHKNQAQAG